MSSERGGEILEERRSAVDWLGGFLPWRLWPRRLAITALDLKSRFSGSMSDFWGDPFRRVFGVFAAHCHGAGPCLEIVVALLSPLLLSRLLAIVGIPSTASYIRESLRSLSKGEFGG